MKEAICKGCEWNSGKECAEYVAHKLGIKDLRDIDGKFKGNPDADYKDFWHFMLEFDPSINNGSFTSFEDYPEELSKESGIEEWQDKIIRTFIAEFGEEAEYWIYW